MKLIKNNIVLMIFVFFMNLNTQAMENEKSINTTDITDIKIQKFFDVMNIGSCVKNNDVLNAFANIFNSQLFVLFKSEEIAKKAFYKFLKFVAKVNSKSASLVPIVQKAEETQQMEIDGTLPSINDLKIIELICSKKMQTACDAAIKAFDIPDDKK